MSTRVIRSFADLDTMQGQVGHVLTLFSGGLDTMHAVTPVTPIKQDEPAWRDVLVVAFTRIRP